MATRIDGPGLAKLETLDRAITMWQRLHSIVEHMAGAQRMQQNLGPFKQQVQRAAIPLASLLKPQFEPISDMVTGIVLVTTRGGSDGTRVRSLRENMGQVKAQLDAAQSRVRKEHTVTDG
jgi:hypothetical protein